MKTILFNQRNSKLESVDLENNFQGKGITVLNQFQLKMIKGGEDDEDEEGGKIGW